MSSLLLEVNGVQYSNFESASVSLQLDAISGSFEFAAVATNNNPFPIKLGDLCAIYADEQKVLTGYVEIISIEYSSSSHSINISGRGKTADIIDSMISALEIKPPITLKSAIEKIVSHIKSDILVIDNVGDIKKFGKAEDIISPEIGENAFEFIEKLARKRQVLLTSDADGNIVLTRSGGESAPSDLQNIIGGELNNIESARVNYDSTNRFGRYFAKSQLNLTALNSSGEASSKSIVDQKSTAVLDDEIRSSRQLVLQSESASSDSENENRIRWEANIRKTRSISYSIESYEFSVNGKLWGINQLTSIKDDFACIDGVMLINSLTFTQESDSTNLSINFVDKNSYSLKINESENGNNLGGCFVK